MSNPLIKLIPFIGDLVKYSVSKKNAKKASTGAAVGLTGAVALEQAIGSLPLEQQTYGRAAYWILVAVCFFFSTKTSREAKE